jgi:hypothetical protein
MVEVRRIFMMMVATVVTKNDEDDTKSLKERRRISMVSMKRCTAIKKVQK